MLDKIIIEGLHSEPKTFKYATIVRILQKHGAKMKDIYRIERELYEDRRTKFKQYKLKLPSVKVLVEDQII